MQAFQDLQVLFLIFNCQTPDKAARSLYTIANVLSDMAYHKYMMDVGNDMLREKNMELDFLANYDMLLSLTVYKK